MQTHLVQGGLRPRFLRLFCRPFGPWAVAAAGGLALAGSADSRGQPPVPVVVGRVATMELAAGQAFVGTVIPARTSDVGSAVDGRLVEFPIVDGQHVAEGEPIAGLLRGLLEIERQGALAEMERRRQVLAELRAGSRPEEIDQARAIVAGFEARVAYARSRLARLGRLAESGTSTVDELQDAQTELQATEAELAGAKAALVALGPLTNVAGAGARRGCGVVAGGGCAQAPLTRRCAPPSPRPAPWPRPPAAALAPAPRRAAHSAPFHVPRSRRRH